MPKKEENPFKVLARKAHKLLTGKTVVMIGGKGLKKAIRHAKTKISKAKPGIKDTIRTKAITAQLRKSLTEKEIAKLRDKK